MDIEKILFTTDFSDTSSEALPHALKIAQKYNAAITLLHVSTLYDEDPNRPEYHFLDEGKYEEYVERSIGKISRQFEPLDRVTTALVRDLNPGPTILEFIQENSIDLTVMGTHARSGLGHFFLGSVAEQVVRHASCPVLTVAKGRDHYLNNPDYENILIAFDFSEYSKQAARQAKEVADRYGAGLQALYIIEQEVPPSYYGVWKKSVMRDLPRLETEVKESLLEAVGDEAGDGLDVEVRIGEAKAHTEIREFARSNRVDLIVMGTHGRSGLDRMLLGSTTERVIRIAPCPVLTFKLPADES
jgi:nucleotide-binding universal stress UspA family protein